MTLVPDGVFRAFLSVSTGSIAGLWVIHDAVLFARLRKVRADALVGDQRFGYVMGIVIGIVGVVGSLRYSGVL